VEAVKPVFMILGLSLFVFLCLLYLRIFGWDEFSKFLMNNALGYTLAFAGGGLLADLIREARS
jgi:small-conductance mechanosensitive channel